MNERNKKMSAAKYEREIRTVDEMIHLYCRKNHKTDKGKLCESCNELSNYCHYRLSLCPWGDQKPFCSNCPIHCYNKEHRECIRTVMRFSGPRMIFHHPILAIRHLMETKREKKKMEKKKNETK